ncbi:MAG: S41 family peptidase [Pirellulaceae bacterium]|nr:S41 family peptidase [Pirellulaceae bacterium]
MPRRNLIILFVASVLSLVCYQRAARNRFVDTLAEAMNYVRTDYVDEVEPRVLFEGAMQGMMNQLDMYSGYTPPAEYVRFKETMDGELTGIGIEIEPDLKTNEIIVLMPRRGSPAAEAGIKPRDVIVAVGDTKTADVPMDEAIGLIKGTAGTKVKLTLRRPGEPQPLVVEVPRARIAMESVLGDARREDGTWIYRLVSHPRIGYIRITNFTERTAADLKAALETYRQPGQEIDGLILDVRGDEGGLLTAAEQTCDLFLDSGLIVSTRGRGGVLREATRATPGTAVDPKLPMVVLVDRESASASEIVAACLQDHHRAAIVGQRTWGKGTVQNLLELEGGKSALRLTIASYWRPSGKDIHKRRNAKETDDWGVRPDDGLELVLTGEQHAQYVKGRRERDVSSLAELEAEAKLPRAKPAATKPVEPPPTDDGNEAPAPAATPKPPAPIPDPGEDVAPVREPFVDLQLDKAVEYLQRQIAKRSAKPREA